MKKTIIILMIFFLILIGCYEQKITFSKNAQGSISYKVEYYDEFDNLVSYLSENFNIDINTSVFFDKRELKRLIDSSSRRNKITNHTIKKRDNLKIAEVDINFSDFESLPKKMPQYYFPVIIKEDNNTISCTNSLSLRNLTQPIDTKEIYSGLLENEKKIIDSYSTMIKLKFIYEAPKAILNTGKGKLSKGNKKLTFETNLYELLNSKNDIEISFSFRK